MDHSCMKQLVNPYRECRKQAATYNRALSSMEKAAELLGVAVSTMSNYELGITVPPVDIMELECVCPDCLPKSIMVIA